MEPTSQTPPPYQLGDTDEECRYPVRVDDQHHLGLIFRWHGGWFAIPAGQSEALRVGDGGTGKNTAALYLVSEYNEGRIVPQDPAADAPEASRALIGPVPLLHPRLPVNDRNTEHALVAMAALTAYLWTPKGGYPGSDNPWFMECELCHWRGPRYWSHLRGRNQNPPSPHRHPGGCIGADQVRARIAAYQQ
ncbi:hypothetical protein [Streptomyces sp. MJM1172]|uniref:hypothetical protein n=1 Tax=Streptomyces sp. MJM1172 TaxID=1703926 RepID=UPI000939AE6E|nr:hypothetical protein [Streptomyces sp. MJM1172]